MDLLQAISTRRTVKAFEPAPLSRAELDELFESARWAPNHKLTQPWRFRVLGDAAKSELKRVASDVAARSAPDGSDPALVGAVAAKKLDRAPTLVTVSSVRNPDPVLDAEDYAATAVAAYLVLLTAHANGLAGYWRTPEVLRDTAGTEAVGIGADEEVLGLLYLGRPSGDLPPAPERAAVDDFVTYLD